MKFCRKLSLFLSVLLLIQLLSASVFADEESVDASVANGCCGIDAQVPLLGSEQITENAQSIVVFESGTDTLMYTWNPDEQLHPAGMVKIMTALLAIEHGSMTDIVTVKESVLNTVSKDARTCKIQVDEVFTVEQLIYCVLVEGANDASAVLADHIAGSQEAFVKMMNERASEIGCTSTVFTNAHGLHDEAQLTTARDVARILDVAIENETFVDFFGATHYTVDATNKSEARELESSNHMMHEGLYEIYFDERITGGRTGVNNAGLRCIATTAKQGELNMICVVMGAESKITDRGIVEKIGGFYETSDLLDVVFPGLKPSQLLYENQALKQYAVRNGSADVVVAPAVSVKCVVPADATVETFTYRYVDVEDAFTAPVKSGQHMSKVEIWHGNVCIGQADLYALNDVSVNYQQIIQKDKSRLSIWIVLLIVVIAIVIVATAALYVVRLRNIRRNAKTRARKQRRTHRHRREM